MLALNIIAICLEAFVLFILTVLMSVEEDKGLKSAVLLCMLMLFATITVLSLDVANL